MKGLEEREKERPHVRVKVSCQTNPKTRADPVESRDSSYATGQA